MIKRYECTNSFFLDEYDESGFYTKGWLEIHKGEIFELYTDDTFRMVGDKDSIRMENEKHWIEIDECMLEKYFKEIDVSNGGKENE